MEYEPLKQSLNNLIKNNRFFRNCFYLALDVLILRQWYVKKHIRKHIDPHKHFICYDAGAGFCQYSHDILHRFPASRVYGIDVNTDFIFDFQKSLSMSDKERFMYETADLTSYILPEKANLVLAIDILEHIVDDVAVLKNFYESLDIGGRLIISTPTDNDSSSSFTAEHVRAGYSISDLTQKLSNVGFNIIYQEYTYGFWGQIYWKLVMRNSLWMVGKSNVFICILPLYLVVVYLPALFCMWLDYVYANKSGNGVIVIGEKPTALPPQHP